MITSPVYQGEVMQQSRYISIRNMTITLIVMMSVFPFCFMFYSLFMERTHLVNGAIQESAIQNEKNARLIIQTVESSELLLNMLSRLPIVQAGDEQTVNVYLLDLVSRYPQYSSIFIVDKTGKRWATTNQMSGAVSYSDRKYFVNAISSGNFSSGEYAIGKIKKKPVFSFGQPVRNGLGAITGVAVATIELSGLKSLLQQYGKGDDKSVIVMDHAGKILIHTAHAEFEGKQEEKTVFLRMQQGPKEATMETERGQGTSRIFAYKKLHLPGEASPYMYVLLESEKDQLLKDTKRQFGIKISLLLATMCSSLFLAYWFSKRFVLKKAEASEQRYQDLFSRAGDGIFVMSTEGRLIEVNESFASMHGYTSEEMLRFGLEGLDTPETSRLAPERMAKVLAGESLVFEVEHFHKDGHIFPLEVSTSMISAGGEAYIQCFHRDITERKLAEISIREISETFSTAFNSAPMMMTISNVGDGTYLDVNQKFLKVSGFSMEEVIGKTSVELGWVTESDRNKLKEILLLDGRVNGLELELKAKSGQMILCTFWGEIITVAGEKRLLSIALDITEQHNLEKQLLQAQKLESLGVLAGGIAHDFNNLLAVIVGHCSLAKLRPSKAVDSIQSIETAAQRAAALCQQMLAYAGKSNFIQTEIHLDELVKEMVSMATSSIGKNVELKSDITPDIPPVTVDASQIRQVVMNLIINASESIGESQGEVLVFLAKRMVKADQHTYDYLGNIILPGWYACLEVTDNGCGMDNETQRRIFEPFYTTKFTGRGLGMSAVLGIVNGHKGALQLFSKPGTGSTFKVYIPIQIGEDCVNESPPQAALNSWKSKGTVLLVEDEEEVQIVGKMMLEELGFSVLKASNGEEGLEMFQNHIADISFVITDIGMPVMDGYSLFRELKQLKPDLPVIISSGFGDNDIAAHIPREKIAGIVGKPYNLDQLAEVLKVIVG